MRTNNKLIVVLGMHRSGTSAITRGLQVMGVELGDKLIAPIEGVNAKGFWEDIDLNALNIEMLNAIDSDWHHLTPIEPSNVDILRKKGYFFRAVEMLRQKVSSVPIFGFKDPRVAKLLSFWKEVVRYCQFDVSYVIAVRHPLSVVKSLAIRDGIETGQSYLLWLGHVVTSLTGSIGEKRVLVDYDRLMQSPGRELMRVAECIGSEIDHTELQSYKNDFLDQGLRHTVYDLKDLLLDDTCPFIVREIYTALLDVASNKTKFDDVELQNKVVHWSDEFTRLRSSFLLIDKISAQNVVLTQALAEGKIQIAKLSQAVVERDGEILSICQSNSWRITAPLRMIFQKSQAQLVIFAVRMAWLRYLITRSLQVIRYQGLSACWEKMMRYLGGAWRRKITSLKSRGDFKLVPLNTITAETNNPMVSFVIPIYDRTDTLRVAILSALDQSYQNIEVILVTDGSPPETLDVIAEFINDQRVRIFNYPTNSGNAVRGRNKGILEANGKYIAFLDSDDVAMPDRIEVSLPLLESGEADVVYGAWRVLLDGTRETEGLANGQLFFSHDCDLETLKQACIPCQSTVVVRKALLYRAGFLKPKMRYREDHELWVRLAYLGGRFRSIPHVLANLRLHAGNNELNFKHDDLHWQSLMLAEYTESAFIPQKIAFIVASLGISGGLIVILKYANLLMSVGHDVLIINVGESGVLDWAGEISVPIISINCKLRYTFEKIDLLFSTFWSTCEWLARIPAKRKLYFIQSDERLFYEDSILKGQVAATYALPYEFVTISGWLCNVLDREFSKKAYIVPNGIDNTIFRPCIPLVAKDSNRLRVLIEGPINISFKGVADAYAAIESLDCEIWVVSSAGKPGANWRIDHFLECVPFKDMPKVYSSCDILLKMSRVESFSYPPLEAMACGCAVIVSKVLGAMEYVVDGVNALVVEQGDVNNAREAVKRLIGDSELRARLVNEGYETVKNWTWERSFEAMLKVVDGIVVKG